MRILQGRHRAAYPTFDEIADAHLQENTPLVDANFGKASVNCCLKGRDCLWGKYQDDQAAILHMIIAPKQDNQWKMDSFELKLSFTEKDPTAQTALQPKLPEPTTGQPQQPPQITKPLVILELPAPRYISGVGTVQQLTTEQDYSAEIPTPIGSARTPGYKRTKERELKNRWHWKSNWVSIQRKYTQATWQWQANIDNPIIEDVGDLYAGLILRHASQPFWVQCEVQGKLASGRKRFQYGHDKNRKPEITRIIADSSITDLQKEAEELDKKMAELTFAAAARIYNAQS